MPGGGGGCRQWSWAEREEDHRQLALEQAEASAYVNASVVVLS